MTLQSDRRSVLIALALSAGCRSLPATTAAGTQPAIVESDLRSRLATFADDSQSRLPTLGSHTDPGTS